MNGNRNRVDGNHASMNDYGISMNNGRVKNVIERNFCGNCTTGNCFVPAGNHFAPVITPGNTFSGATPGSNIAQ